MDLRRKDQLSSLFWLIISLAFCIASVRLSLGGFHQPGSGLFPFLAGAALCVLAFFNLLSAIRRRRQEPIGGEGSRSKINWKNIILTLGILFAFPFLLDLIGFPLTAFLFFAFLLRFIEPQRWSVVLVGAGMAAVLFSLIFQFWLKIRFPIGILGF